MDPIGATITRPSPLGQTLEYTRVSWPDEVVGLVPDVPLYVGGGGSASYSHVFQLDADSIKEYAPRLPSVAVYSDDSSGYYQSILYAIGLLLNDVRGEYLNRSARMRQEFAEGFRMFADIDQTLPFRFASPFPTTNAEWDAARDAYRRFRVGEYRRAPVRTYTLEEFKEAEALSYT